MGWGGGGGGGSSSWSSSWSSGSSSWSSGTTDDPFTPDVPKAGAAADGDIHVTPGGTDESPASRESDFDNNMQKFPGAYKDSQGVWHVDYNGKSESVRLVNEYAVGYKDSSGELHIVKTDSDRAGVANTIASPPAVDLSGNPVPSGAQLTEVYGVTGVGSGDATVFAGAINNGNPSANFSADYNYGGSSGNLSGAVWTSFVVDHELAHGDSSPAEGDANYNAVVHISNNGY